MQNNIDAFSYTQSGGKKGVLKFINNEPNKESATHGRLHL